MKTGLFFGSFNPIHCGHVQLANYFVEYTDIAELWFVISPQNPLKNKSTLINDAFRLEMVDLAIRDDSRFRACDIEFRMPKPSYTIDTLTYLSEKYPGKEFVLIMGYDGLSTFYKWKNFEMIIKKYHRYVYPRGNHSKTSFDKSDNITYWSDAPQIEISSSFIRNAIKEGKNIRYFLPDSVFHYLEKTGLYRQ